MNKAIEPITFEQLGQYAGMTVEIILTATAFEAQVVEAHTRGVAFCANNAPIFLTPQLIEDLYITFRYVHEHAFTPTHRIKLGVIDDLTYIDYQVVGAKVFYRYLGEGIRDTNVYVSEIFYDDEENFEEAFLTKSQMIHYLKEGKKIEG